jgi:hypothetical protein
VAARAQRAEVDRLRAELERHGPYLALAEQLHAEVDRVVADPDGDLDEFGAAIDRWPREAREAAVIAAFGQLPAEQQWEILARLFDDDTLRAALAAEYERAAAVALIAADQALDTRLIPAGEQLVLGLFREADVRAALARGAVASTVARRLVLRATDEPGRMLVIEDVFNPARGLFVSADYDEDAWRSERLVPYSVVTVGAAVGELEPIVYPGGRLDVQTVAGLRVGRLHTGFATVGDVDLFVSTSRAEARKGIG